MNRFFGRRILSDQFLLRPYRSFGSSYVNFVDVYAIATVVPEHLAEVRDRKLALIAKTEAVVKDRLTKEVMGFMCGTRGWREAREIEIALGASTRAMNYVR